MKCVRCSKIIDDEDLFCGYCGINQLKFTKYIKKVEIKIHKEKDKEYNNKIKNAQNKLKSLEKSKQSEINRIINSRWNSINKNFSYNMTEGKININGQIYSFSDIKGAEINTSEGVRNITNTTGTNNAKSKKHISIGGAIAGGLISGGIGAVVGGSTLGKTTTKGKNNQVTTSNDIPVCYHIGVLVNLNGFTAEIILLSKAADIESSLYNKTFNKAQIIVNKLRTLSLTPVPKKWLKPEEEQSVLNIDLEIENAAKNLKKVMNDKPNYDIPESYYK